MTGKTKKNRTAAKASLSRRLAAYSLAAGAALALPQAAEAEIVCGNIDTTIGVGDPFLTIDGDGDGTVDMVFGATAGGSIYYAMAMVRPGGDIQVAPLGSFPFALNQPASVSLPPGVGAWFGSLTGGYGAYGAYGLINVGYFPGTGSSGYAYGDFSNGAPGYIGVRFEVTPGDYIYGWVEYTADLTRASFGGHVGWWALETDVNRPITPGVLGACGQASGGGGGGGGGGGCFIEAGTE